MNKDQKITTDVHKEETNMIPMKTEVEVKTSEDQKEPAKIIFITSGFGKIDVANTKGTSPMAFAA